MGDRQPLEVLYGYAGVEGDMVPETVRSMPDFHRTMDTDEKDTLA